MRSFLALVLSLMTVAPVVAQTSYPMITHSTPTAIQRGKSAEITVEGQMNFADAYRVFIEGSGVTATVLSEKMPTPSTKTVRLQMTAAADAALGVREFRIATKHGISSLGQLLVVDDPVVLEAAKNNTLAESQKVTLPVVVAGRIEAVEDVDTVRFTGKKGDTLSAQVYCARIQDKIHDLQKHADPLIVLLDAEGRELSANDDFYFADPAITFTLPRDGDYVVEIRDAKYDGDPRWAYALMLTTRPQVTHLYPLAVTPGSTSQVEAINGVKPTTMTVVAPKELGLHAPAFSVNGTWTNPTALITTSLPLTQETEPNDDSKSATRITIPAGINGRIGRERDLDTYVFAASKGKVIRFEVMARRFGTVLQSGVDSVLDVMSADGKLLITNDDTNGKDASVSFTPPADGDYYLRIRDLNSKGGPTFPYFISAEYAAPDFALKIDPAKAMIGPGTSQAWYVALTRLNGFTGPVDVVVTGLSKGVTVNSLTIPESMTQGVLVLSAAADAKVDAAVVQVSGSATLKTLAGGEEKQTRPATMIDEIYLPGGGRGRFEINMAMVGVTDASDVSEVVVTPNQLTLRPGQEVKLDVTVERKAGFTGNVNLDIILRHLNTSYANPLPTGVTMVDAKSKTLIPAGATKGHITLKVAPDAPAVENVPICVMANVSINFVVKISYTSKPILVTIQK